MKKELKYTIFKTKWGFFGLLADNTGLLRTTIPTRSFQIAKRYLLVGMLMSTKEDEKLYPELQKYVTAYYKGSYINSNRLNFTVSGSKLGYFACKVLKVCKEVPMGKTITYRQLAKKAGFPKAARAVGNVLAKNSLPLLIPCHRVIRSDGKIGNFSALGGAKTKKKMLEHEKLIATKTQRHKVF
jgi:methylated-DNA-[protein]-cysteine S-methyltransferase